MVTGGRKGFLYINNSQVDVTFFLPLYGYYTVITIPYAWVDFPLTAGWREEVFRTKTSPETRRYAEERNLPSSLLNIIKLNMYTLW